MAEVVTNCWSETLAQGELTRGLVSAVAVTSIGEHDEFSLMVTGVNFFYRLFTLHPIKGGGFGD